MLRTKQALLSVTFRRLPATLLILACSIAVSGCGMTMKSVDSDAVTNAISPQTAATGDTERVSDEVTVRNAISAVDPQTAGGETIAWANADTGSRGAISALVESREANDVLCRQFTTTRESFDGVALYQGKACKVGPNSWQMMAFSAL